MDTQKWSVDLLFHMVIIHCKSGNISWSPNMMSDPSIIMDHKSKPSPANHFFYFFPCKTYFLWEWLGWFRIMCDFTLFTICKARGRCRREHWHQPMRLYGAVLPAVGPAAGKHDDAWLEDDISVGVPTNQGSLNHPNFEDFSINSSWAIGVHFEKHPWAVGWTPNSRGGKTKNNTGEITAGWWWWQWWCWWCCCCCSCW